MLTVSTKKAIARRRPRLESCWSCAATVIICAGFLSAPAGAATWDHAHGDAANSGFADVATDAAQQPLATQRGMGSFASGVGPVIGPDGTVYLGSEQGVLWALHADGSPYWHRALDRPGESIKAPPVVDTDGAIYVVSTYEYTDNRVNPPVKHRETRLYRFTPGGGVGWAMPLPDHGSIAQGPDQGVVSAPLNVLHENGTTTILISAGYPGRSAYETRLIGMSNSGALAGDIRLGLLNYGDVTGNSGLTFVWPFGFAPTQGTSSANLPDNTAMPMPGVALAGSDIVATDGFHSVIHLGFNPAAGFTVRSHLDRDGMIALTGASVLPNGESVSGERDMHLDDNKVKIDNGHLLFTGPLETEVANANFDVASMPAHTADGRIVFAAPGALQVLDGQTPLANIGYGAETIATPAISRNDIFVSTANSLRSYDVKSLTLISAYGWVGGGLSSPAIGPTGRVYALASNTLYIWPAPYCVEHPGAPRCGVLHNEDNLKHSRP
jgi:hypothetical protein